MKPTFENIQQLLLPKGLQIQKSDYDDSTYGKYIVGKKQDTCRLYGAE